MGSPEGLLKQGSWSPPRLGLPCWGLTESQTARNSWLLQAQEKLGEEKKKEKKCFRPRGEMSLLISRIRGLKEPAHRGMGWGRSPELPESH